MILSDSGIYGRIDFSYAIYHRNINHVPITIPVIYILPHLPFSDAFKHIISASFNYMCNMTKINLAVSIGPWSCFLDLSQWVYKAAPPNNIMHKNMFGNTGAIYIMRIESNKSPMWVPWAIMGTMGPTCGFWQRPKPGYRNFSLCKFDFI